MTALRAQVRPCGDCPWRKDVPVGKFAPDRFRALAKTSADMGRGHFQCHKSSDQAEVVCAGFLARGAVHNLSVRLAAIAGALDLSPDRSGGFDLFDTYREMAIANGVPADDPALGVCRDV